MLELHREQVSRWDFREGRHKNPIGCPIGFPTLRIRGPHAHIWVEDRDMRCARPLERKIAQASHAAAFDAFCERHRIDVELRYQPPPEGEQLVIDDEDAS
jgi:hypothetical protein